MMISGLNLVLVMARREIDDAPVRKVIECAEVRGLTPRGEIEVELLFDWDAKTDTWPLLTESYYLQKAAKMRGITIEEAKHDIMMRAEILNYLSENNMRSFSQVTQMIRNYVSETIHESISTS